MSVTDKLTEHGIQLAYYSNGPDGLRPVLQCLCDWETEPSFNWTEAGEGLDAHLSEVMKAESVKALEKAR